MFSLVRVRASSPRPSLLAHAVLTCCACLSPAHQGNYTFAFYDWQCDGLTGNELTGYYTLALDGEEVYRGGTIMDTYWEEVDLEVRHIETQNQEASHPEGADPSFATEKRTAVVTGHRPEIAEESSGRGARGGWMPILLTVATGAVAWGWS